MPAAVVVVAAYAGSAAGTFVAGAAVTAGFSAVGAAAAGALAGAVAGAIAGGITAAVTGEDIGDGMTMGAMSGAIGGGVSGWGTATEAVEGGTTLAEAQSSITSQASGAEMSGSSGVDVMGSDQLFNPGTAESNLSTDLTLGNIDSVSAVEETSKIAVDNNVKNVSSMINSSDNSITRMGVSNYVKDAAGKLGDFLPNAGDETTAALVDLGGNVVSGLGQADLAETQAQEARDAADLAYERETPKLQEGVNLDTRTFTLNDTQWQTSAANPIAVAQPTAPATAPPPQFTNYKASLDQGLLNA